MYDKVLLAFDGSVDGSLALREGAELARLCGGSVFLLAVVNIPSGIMLGEAAAPGLVEQQRAAFQEVLAGGLRRLEALGFRAKGQLEFGEPAQAIANAAREIKADIVVIGHRRESSFARWWRGSVGISLLKELQCSLLVAQMGVGKE